MRDVANYRVNSSMTSAKIADIANRPCIISLLAVNEVSFASSFVVGSPVYERLNAEGANDAAMIVKITAPMAATWSCANVIKPSPPLIASPAFAHTKPTMAHRPLMTSGAQPFQRMASASDDVEPDVAAADDDVDVRDALARAMASAVGMVISTAAGGDGAGDGGAGAAATVTRVRFCVDDVDDELPSRFCVGGARNSAGRQHERVAYIVFSNDSLEARGVRGEGLETRR